METKYNHILLRIKNANDLFYKSVIPLSGRLQLHPDVEAFILENAEKLNSNLAFVLTIQVEEFSSETSIIPTVIREHFESMRQKAIRQLRSSLKLGLESLFVGFAFLVAMYLLTRLLAGFLLENTLMITLKELFVILAWVALWRPADLLLYEWRPYKRKANLFERIIKTEVQVAPLQVSN